MSLSAFIPRFAVMVLVACLLFLAAGRWDLPFLWACLGLYVAAIPLVVLTIDRDLLKERVNPGPGGEDRHLRRNMLMLALPAWLFTALDLGRLHWSDTVPMPLRYLGLIMLAISFALAIWIMRTNPFFSPVVRIQHERRHRLITAGPYRVVRHPGYVATIAMLIGSGLAMGSWLAMALVVAMLGLILRRTALEDRFLHQHLDGYTQYATRVRGRLIPGIW